MMTREEAIVNLEKLIALFHTASEQNKMVDYSKIIETLEFAAAALRPVSRERVEKVWRGEWNQDERGRVVCNRCGSIAAIGTENALHNAKKYDRFCFYCGAPMTDEAVEMVMKRLEVLESDARGTI